MQHSVRAVFSERLKYFSLPAVLELTRTDDLDLPSMATEGCISYVTNATGMSLNINYTIPESVEDAILDTTFAEDIIYFVLALLFFLVVLVFGFMLLLTVMGRFMRLGIVVSLAPFGFAWFSGELTKDMGKAHMKTILSTAMEGLVLAVAIILSAAFVNNLGVTYDDTGGGTRVKVYNVRWNSSPTTRSVNGTETQGIEVRAEVVNAYTSGGYSADYSSYPSNRFRNAIVETNVPDSSMIRYGRLGVRAIVLKETKLMPRMWLQSIWQ